MLPKLYFVFGLGILIAACSDSSSGVPAPGAESIKPTGATLVFVDKTVSNHFDSAQISNWTADIMPHLRTAYRQNGDRFRIIPVHENTMGAHPLFDGTFEVEELPDLEAYGKSTQRRMQEEFQESQLLTKRTAQRALQRALDAPIARAVAQETDLWGTFELCSRYFQTLPTADRYLIYYSDMIESKRGPDRRDYHRRPFKSRDAAHKAATADAELIRAQYDLNPDILRGTEVRMVFPNRSFERNDSEYYRYYWEALFGEFGMKLR